MTDLSDYTTEQTLARDLLITAGNGGSNHWAHVHGLSVDCPPEQVRAEGIDAADRSVWRFDLADISRAISKLIDTPYQCADPDFSVDPACCAPAARPSSTPANGTWTRLPTSSPPPAQHPITTGSSSSR